MAKHIKQRSKNKSRRINKKSRRTQRGGFSNAGVLNSARNGSVNEHNVNPQASADLLSKLSGGATMLNNKSMEYGQPVPLGNNILQGGSNCGNEGVGTHTDKPQIFKQYLESLSQKLDETKGGSVPCKQRSSSKSKRGSRSRSQKGAGFSTDPGEFIAGLPVYKSYDDCCPPAIINGQLQFGAPDQSVCGFGAFKGGSRKRLNTSRKTKKQRTHPAQKGGDWNSVGHSKPAEYSTAFNGPSGVFAYPEDMSKRTFDETQPNYSVNAI